MVVGIIFSIEKPGFREVKLVPKHATAGRRLNQEKNLGSLDSKLVLALLYPDTPPMHSLMKWRAYCEGVWHPASPWKERAWGLQLAGGVAMGLLQPHPLNGSILLPFALSNTWKWAPARSGVFSVLIPNYSLRLISCLTSQPTPLPQSLILWSHLPLVAPEVPSYLTLGSVSPASSFFLHHNSAVPSGCASLEG